MSAREDVTFPVGSRDREAIPQTLTVKPRRPTALMEYCDCARETAQRTLAGFRDRGRVKKGSDGLHHLTPNGTMVHERYKRFIEMVECADRMSEFLVNTADTCENVPSGVLGQVNITVVTDNDPHASFNKYLTIIGSEPVDRFRGVVPIVNRVFNEPVGAVLGEDTRMELIVDRSVLECSMDIYPNSFERTWDPDQSGLRVTEGNLDFGLLVVDGHGLISAYGEHNNLTILVDGDMSEVVPRVEILYRSVRSTSVPIDRLES